MAAAKTRPGDAALPSRQAKAVAGITPLPPACQILPTIEHPRFTGGLSGFTGLNRVNAYPCQLKKMA
jgi:hypothetical protein